MEFKSVDHVKTALERADYICSKTIATVVFLAQATQKPVLVEGPAGVGKTELSKAVARSLERELIRLQCYEGLDEAKLFDNLTPQSLDMAFCLTCIVGLLHDDPHHSLGVFGDFLR